MLWHALAKNTEQGPLVAALQLCKRISKSQILPYSVGAFLATRKSNTTYVAYISRLSRESETLNNYSNKVIGMSVIK